jgi:hypothetical protein
MTASSPTRIDEDVTSAAKVAAEVFSRSTAQQVNHWARIGRELEASTSISQRDIAEVLAGRASYDALREGLDLAAEFAAAGESWTEADAAGAPVERSGAAARPRRRRRTA